MTLSLTVGGSVNTWLGCGTSTSLLRLGPAVGRGSECSLKLDSQDRHGSRCSHDLSLNQLAHGVEDG